MLQAAKDLAAELNFITSSYGASGNEVFTETIDKTQLEVGLYYYINIYINKYISIYMYISIYQYIYIYIYKFY